MMKKGLTRVIASILAVIMVTLIMPVADMGDIFSMNAYAATKDGNLGGNVKWKYDTKTRVLTITGSGDMGDSKNVSDKNDKFDVYLWDKVTDIYKHATRVVIGEGVTNIGSNTFRNFSALTTVQLPSTIKTIKQSAFENCSKLNNINLPEGLTTIGNYAFKKTALTSITAPYTLTSVGDHAFANVYGLIVTCNFGDAAYNYCKANSIKTNFRTPEVVLTSEYDVASKQVTLAIKVKNGSLLNAANFKLSYEKGLTPVSKEDVTPSAFSEGDATYTAIYHGEDNTISVGLLASGEVGYANCKGQCEYTVCAITFNCVEGEKTAGVTLKTTAFMSNNEKLAIGDIVRSNVLHEHKIFNVPAKDPTCTEDGSTAGKECEICKEMIEAYTVIPALGHSFEDVVTAPTCTKGGYTTQTCSVCDFVQQVNPTEAKGHSFDEGVVTAPTCTEGGYTTQTCTVCTFKQTINPTEATGHSFNEGVVTAPTCTEVGYTTQTCTVCKTTQKVNETKATGHSFDKGVVTAPTCKEGGYTTQTCKACKITRKVDEKPTTDHSFDKGVVTAPTCKEGGYTTQTCTVCKITQKVNETKATGHKFEDKVTAPTCTEGGYTTQTCTACKTTQKVNETKATGHKFDKGVVTPPTCTEVGYTTQTCTACKTTQKVNETKATGHKYGEGVVTAPTCTEGGYTTQTCTQCAHVQIIDEVGATGHTAGVWTIKTKATWYKEGVLETKCTVCGETMTKKYKRGEEPVVPETTTANVDETTTAKQDETTTAKQEETTTKKVEPTTKKEEPTSKKEEPTSKKEEPTSKKEESTTKKVESTTKKEESTTKKEESTTKKVESTTKKEESTTKKEEPTTKEEETTTKTPDEPVSDVVELPSSVEDNSSTEPPVTEPTYAIGDINGDGRVTATDARIALRIATRLEKLEDQKVPVFAAVDANGDGKITATDARKILRVATKLEKL